MMPGMPAFNAASGKAVAAEAEKEIRCQVNHDAPTNRRTNCLFSIIKVISSTGATITHITTQQELHY